VLVIGHGKKLEESIISETSGHLKRLLVALLQANRPEGNTIDRRKARNDAKALFEAGEKKFGTDESRFNVILCSRFIFTLVIFCVFLVKIVLWHKHRWRNIITIITTLINKCYHHWWFGIDNILLKLIFIVSEFICTVFLDILELNYASALPTIFFHFDSSVIIKMSWAHFF